MDRQIAVLGSSGSVGRQALDVAAAMGISVDALTGGKNAALLEDQARAFSPRFCAMADEIAAKELRERLADTDIKIFVGETGILELIERTSAKAAVHAIVGLAGLMPALAAAKRGMRIAIANKEPLVAAGELLFREAAAHGAEILPVDSEHSAVFQCLQAGKPAEVKRILLTASGGPFFGMDRAALEHVTASDALKHPTWSMGQKITIDSATLMNKGLEVIEAVRLFGVRPDQIQVVVHRESIIHSAVEYIDNVVLAQMAVPDMRSCIQYALTWPERAAGVSAPLDLFSVGRLTFAQPDMETFRCLKMAYRAISVGGLMPTVLSAANEAAVDLFLSGRIRFLEIASLVEAAMDGFANQTKITVEDIFAADRTARAAVYRMV